MLENDRVPFIDYRWCTWFNKLFTLINYQLVWNIHTLFFETVVFFSFMIYNIIFFWFNHRLGMKGFDVCIVL